MDLLYVLGDFVSNAEVYYLCDNAWTQHKCCFIPGIKYCFNLAQLAQISITEDYHK